jgi:hypothetical protein
MNSRPTIAQLPGRENRPGSVRERPEPQLFLGDLPQARQAQRFDYEEKDDERAKQDQGQASTCTRGLKLTKSPDNPAKLYAFG